MARVLVALAVLVLLVLWGVVRVVISLAFLAALMPGLCSLFRIVCSLG